MAIIPTQPFPFSPQDTGDAPWGYRNSGDPKGDGFLGPIIMNDGRTMTEVSVGVEFDN